MKKLIFMALVLLILGSIGVKAEAWVLVPDGGDTGWQTYVYDAGSGGFTGTAGFVVSNVIDNNAFSELLLDNLSHGGGGTNRSFEMGNYSNFNLLGNSYGEVTSQPVLALSFNEYQPVHGDYMSHQFALANGISTATFRNANGQAGTVGSILETDISLSPGDHFSFSWAFLGNDSQPWNDFSLFYLKNHAGVIVLSQGLGQIGSPSAVPFPSTLLLTGTALLGLWGISFRSKGN